MMLRGFILLLLLFPAVPQQAQRLPFPSPPRETERRLPNGRSQDLAILKDDYEKSKKDVAEMIKLAKELEKEIEENQEFVVDVRSLRKAEEIEKLAKRVKDRMKRVQ